jgi:hypothetical protein
MINIKTADLTSPGQKLIAGVFVIIALFALYFLLPPLIVIFTNLLIAAVLAAVLLLIAMNYQLIWSMFKRISWEMTKKLISSDPLWHMYQYYHYMTRKIEELNQNIVDVGAIETETNRNINQMIADNKKFKAQAVMLEEKKASESLIKVAQGKVALMQQQIDTFLPKLEYIKNQKKLLTELYDAWSADTELLKSTLDAKAQEYELMKKLSQANTSAMAFLQKDSQALREYKESLKQIESSVAKFTSNVENFQRQVAPQLTRMGAENALNEEEGARLIEEYKKSRIQL